MYLFQAVIVQAGNDSRETQCKTNGLPSISSPATHERSQVLSHTEITSLRMTKRT
jgi:hypothetical protein